MADGTVQIINLKSMSTEVNLPTFFINSDQVLQRSGLQNTTFSERGLLVQLASSLPKYFDMSSDCYAYIFSAINQPDQSEQWRKIIENLTISKNLYAKEVAGKAANIG